MPKPDSVSLGGRTFHLTAAKALDVKQDAYIAAVLERAGLTDPRLKELRGEALIHEGQLRLYESGKVGAFVAGYLVEPKKPWTVDHAQATAKLVDELKDRQGRDEVFGLVGGMLLGFFSHAESSNTPGPSSSPAPDPLESSAPADSIPSVSGSR